MWHYLLIVFFLTLNCQAFNVDTYEPIVRQSLQMDDFDDPVNKDMFGYRVKLYNRSDGPRFIVGAPRGSVVGAMRPNVNVGLYNLSYGVVYSCPVNPGVCEGFDERNGQLYNNTANDPSEQKNGQLLGATIEVGGRGILVCAPRHFTIISNELHPFGKCYRTYGTGVRPTFRFLESGSSSASLCQSISERAGVSPSHTTTSVCETGLSGAIIGNSDSIILPDGDGEILVGVPGSTNWEGGFAVYSSALPGGNLRSFDQTGFGEFERANALMGYDIKYYRSRNNNTDPNIVVSVPGINSLLGFIRFYRYGGGRVISNPLQTVYGTKVGSYFGAALAAVDLNGDGVDEIVVGAPTYSEDDNADIGQIHIYTNFTGSFKLFRTINGMERNARFGFALGSLGDIDDNKLEDFAVGAPFGSGSGTVYIFNGVGGSEMIRQTQVIVGSELSLSLSPPISFGFSFSNGFDVDSNGYPDFAVGSFLSQQVYLFRSRPVANMSLSFNLSSDFLSLDSGACVLNNNMFFCIRISACFNYSGLNVPNLLDINYNFVIERRVQRNSRFSRAFFENGVSSTNGTRRVGADVISCVDDTIYFRNDTEDQFTPISVEFNMFLDPIVGITTNGNSLLSSLRAGPVLRIIGSNQIQIPLIRNCGPDARCIPNLVISNGSKMVQYEVNGEVDDTIETIAAGVVTAVIIPIQLLNNGNESAIGPTITFVLPQGTRFIRAFDINAKLAQICRETDVNNMTQVECDVGFTAEVAKVKDYEFRIQTRGIIGSEENLSITFTANNSLNEDTEPSDNSHTVYFTVTAEADVFIQSSFRPDSVQVGRTEPANITEVTELGPAVSGLFVVRNSGPSLIPNLVLNISWPSMRDSVGNFIIYPSRVVNDPDVECSGPIDPLNYANSRARRQSSETLEINCRNGHEACIVITCNIPNLRANESSIITIEGFVHDSSFLGTTNLWSFTAFSHVDIVEDYITQPIGHQLDNDTANLMGIPPNLDTGSSDDGVEAWVIIVPIVVAIIIIVVAAILLYFFGFFKRKKVGDDEEDLTTWQSPGNAGGETMPQETEPSPATKDSA